MVLTRSLDWLLFGGALVAQIFLAGNAYAGLPSAEDTAASRESATRRKSTILADRGWYRAGQAILLPKEFINSSSADFLVLIDNTDVTPALLSDPVDGSLYFIPHDLLVAPGIHKMSIYIDSGGGDKKLERTIEFGVLDAFGFERSQLVPSGSFELGYQPYLTSRGNALPPPSPAVFADLDYKLGFAAEFERSSWLLKTKQNWVGTSRVTKALRFSELGNEAPRLDLSDYNLYLESPTTKIEVGHVSGMEQNPLLIQTISNRGIYLSQQISPLLRASITAQSGRSTTGYDYLLGFDQEFNNIYSAEISIHPFSVPQHFKLGLSWLRSQQPAVSDFAVGQVPSAESSDGLGLSLSSSIFNDRLITRLTFASSTYSAPQRQEVDEFGLESVFLKSTTNQAVKGEIELALAQSESPFASTLKLSLGQYDPQYKVISGFSESDRRFWDVSLTGSINSIAYSLASGSFRDNLANEPYMLTTRNDSLSTSLGIPLQQILYGKKTGQPGMAWLPDISYNYTYGGQYGINNPVAEPDAVYYFEAQIPKLYTSAHRFGLSWDLSPVSLTFAYNNTWQNNQQKSKSNQDIYNSSFELALSLPLSESLTISPRVLYTKELSQDSFVEQRNLQHGLDFSYQITDSLVFSGGYNYGNQSVSTGLSSVLTWTYYGQVAYSFRSISGKSVLFPGSIFLRLNYASSSQEDLSSGVSDAGSNFWLNAGFSIKFF